MDSRGYCGQQLFWLIQKFALKFHLDRFRAVRFKTLRPFCIVVTLSSCIMQFGILIWLGIFPVFWGEKLLTSMILHIIIIRCPNIYIWALLVKSLSGSSFWTPACHHGHWLLQVLNKQGLWSCDLGQCSLDYYCTSSIPVQSRRELLWVPNQKVFQYPDQALKLES